MIKILDNSNIKEKCKKKIIYNSTNTCDKIKKIGYSWRRCGNKLVQGKVCSERDDLGNRTGKRLCTECYNKNYYKNTKYDPNNVNNIKKPLADYRTGNLNPDSTNAISLIFEDVTCKAKGVKNLNIENNNFCSPIDHSPDIEGKIYQTKYSVYNNKRKSWKFGFKKNEIKKKFDFIICYCVNENLGHIIRVYIFPKFEIMKRDTIDIYEDPSRGGWYENYRFDNKPYDYIYQNRHNDIVTEYIKDKYIGKKTINIDKDIFEKLTTEMGHIGFRSRGKNFDMLNRLWGISLRLEYNIEFSNLIIYCMDKYMEKIVRMYIIPKKEIANRSHISIVENSSASWYENYRIFDIKLYNDMYHKLRGV